MKTYDVIFNDDENSNNNGFKESKEYCIEYIQRKNGTNDGYFADYKGGIVSVICNETGDTEYEEEVK